MDHRRYLTLRIPLPSARDVAAAALTLGVAGLPVARTWGLHWGAHEDELDAQLPGDALLPAADLVATRAIGIAAPPRDVWPWVLQLGRGGGGPDDAPEGLASGQTRPADTVESVRHDVAPGDVVRLRPRVALEVVQVDPGRSLVLRGTSTVTDSDAPSHGFTWSFVLRADGHGGTRLVVRERYVSRTTWGRVGAESRSAVSAVRTRAMLRGIRRRVQDAASDVRPAG